jgi:hypothetical protein
MKIRTLLFIICLALPVFPRSGLVSVALKGGLGLASYWGKDGADSAGMTTTMQSGVCAGAMLALHVNEYIAGQMEFLFSMKGKSAIGDYPAYSKGLTIKTDYFEVPVLLRFSYPVGEISQVIAYAGPTFSFLISSKKDSTVIRQPSQTTITDVTVDTKSQTAPYDIGATVGGGMAVSGGPGEVLFEVRYTLGLVNKYRQTAEEIRTHARLLDIKNSYITFLIGYSITL